MLERDSDWQKFLLCVEHKISRDLISKELGLNRQQVDQYFDMYAGLSVLKQHGTMPEKIAPFAIAFKYRSVIRWVETPEVLQAKKDYDKGLVELATGRALVRGERAWVLYAFPRTVRAKRPLYFSAPAFT